MTVLRDGTHGGEGLHQSPEPSLTFDSGRWDGGTVLLSESEICFPADVPRGEAWYTWEYARRVYRCEEVITMADRPAKKPTPTPTPAKEETGKKDKGKKPK
jgi:hypothetical protein